MTDNPYAPPVSFSERVVAKRRFTSSGAKLLFAGFAVCELVWAIGAHARALSAFAESNQWLWSNVIVALVGATEVLASPLIVLGLWLFIRACRLPWHQFFVLRAIALGSTVIQTLVFWYSAVRYFFPTITLLVNIDVEIASMVCLSIIFLSITMLMLRIAKFRNEQTTAFHAGLTLFLSIPLGIAATASKSTVLDHPIKTLFETGLRLGPHALFLATLWSARKLENASTDSPAPRRKRAKPKRRTSLGAL